MGRRAIETLLSALGLLVLLGVLVSFDPRVHDQVGTILSREGAMTTMAGASSVGRAVTIAVVQSARDQSMAHAPMLVFAVAGAILVAFMLRT